jgi:hypothetical protein
MPHAELVRDGGGGSVVPGVDGTLKGLGVEAEGKPLRIQRHPASAYILLLLPYAPQRSHIMAPETGVCLYPCGDATCAPMAIVDIIPPESQLNWLSGKHLIMPF